MPRRSARRALEGRGVRPNAPPHGTASEPGRAAMWPRAPPRPSSTWLISSRPPAPRPPAAPPQPAARAYAVTRRAVRRTPSGCASAAPGRAGGSRRRGRAGPAAAPARSPARPLGSASAPTRGASAAPDPRACGAAPGQSGRFGRTRGRRRGAQLDGELLSRAPPRRVGPRTVGAAQVAAAPGGGAVEPRAGRAVRARRGEALQVSQPEAAARVQHRCSDRPLAGDTRGAGPRERQRHKVRPARRHARRERGRRQRLRGAAHK